MAELKLDNAAVRTIQARLANGEAVQTIAPAFGVSRQTVYNIKNGKRREHVPGHRRVTHWKPPQKIVMPPAPLEEMAGAEDVEQQARAAARKDRKAGALSKDAFHRRSRATQHAATYLVKHPSLYRHETKEARCNAYEEWMKLYIGWYMDEAVGKGTGKRK